MKKALVQIKSTDRHQTSVFAKLSALKRLVDTDLPAFILHMEFDRDQRPTRLRLLHIGSSEIADIQKAVRKYEHTGRIDFNNYNFGLSLKRAKPLALDGSDAGDTIYGAIPNDPHEYGSLKAKIRKSCGYDEKSYMGGFSLASGLTERDLAYLLVGRTPKLALSSFVVQGSRFGISLPSDRIEADQGELYVEAKPFQKGKITAIAAGGIKRVALSVDVYGSGGADLSPENQILRLSSDFIEWIININTHEDEFQFRIEPDNKYSLKELSRGMSFASLLQEKGTSVAVEFDGKHVANFTSMEQADLLESWSILTEYSSFLNNACDRLWSDPPIEISLRELGKSLEDNAQMYAAATQPGANFVFSGDTTITVPPETEGYILLPICIEFSGLVYIAVVKADALPRSTAEGCISFTGKRPEAIEEFISTRHDGLHIHLNGRIEDLARGASRPGLWIVTAKIAHSETKLAPPKRSRQTNPSRRPVLPQPKRRKKKS